MKILKFGLDHCGPCKALTQQLKSVDLKGISLHEVNAAEDIDLAYKYMIKKVPTMIVLDSNDNVVATLRNLAELNNFLDIDEIEK